MRCLFIKLSVMLVVLGTLLNATAVDYQSLHQQEQRVFQKQMKKEIRKALKSNSVSKEVKTLYKGIAYQAVWVDKNYLTHDAELFAKELKEDFDKGLHQNLVTQYKRLLPNESKLFTSDSLKDRVTLELGIMQLYVEDIEEILKEKESDYTPLSLLQLALKKRSLVPALNAISKERIEYRLDRFDTNVTFLEQSKRINERDIQRLKKSGNKELYDTYERLDFHPIWIIDGKMSDFSKTLFTYIGKDITLDKKSDIYVLYSKLKQISVLKNKEKSIDLEYQIATLYQKYMTHYLYGEINWKKFQKVLKRRRNADWMTHNVLLSTKSLLIDAVNHESLMFAFYKAKPPFALYDRLMMALKRYQNIAENGGWKSLGNFQNLKPGMYYEIVPVLRERLRKEGDYSECEQGNEGTLYDICLQKAIEHFQSRHGLPSKGFVGPMTRKALAETVQEKIKRIKLNLDRMKWIKRSTDRYQIWVNIPAYTMYVIDKNKIIEEMKVIVGRNKHNTPIFYNRVRTIVLNPYWRIPPSIIRDELVPKLKKNSNYTNSKKIEIHTGYSEHSPKVNPYKVNWYKYGRKLPPYKFMQSPGKDNALGKIKYLFPNKYSVYMHDTNEPYLFSKETRALSHGCVRLHRPVDLLKIFSTIDKNIDFDKAENILEENKKTILRLSTTVPVDMIYITVWANEDGIVQFRDDIYGYDKLQLPSI